MSDPNSPNAGLRKVSYVTPDYEGGRGIVLMEGTDLLRMAVQLLKEGARQGVHAHANYDGVYLVLEGRVRFSGIDGVFAEVGPKEAIVVPRGTPYGFEAIGGDAQMYHFSSVDHRTPSRFTAHEPGADEPNYGFFAPDGTPLQRGG